MHLESLDGNTGVVIWHVPNWYAHHFYIETPKLRFINILDHSVVMGIIEEVLLFPLGSGEELS